MNCLRDMQMLKVTIMCLSPVLTSYPLGSGASLLVVRSV